jgi:hypothetical protein
LQSENEDLQKGDVIKKIDEYDVRDLRHVDAQNLLKNSEFVKLAIERSESLPSITDASANRNNSPPRAKRKFVIVPSYGDACERSSGEVRLREESRLERTRRLISGYLQDLFKHAFTRFSEQLVLQLF